MRQGQHKQRSRGRGRKTHNPTNRSYDSNGPDVKIRGTAAHIAEKYSTLARDAQVTGDRIASENYLQHAEHYYRIVAVSQAHIQQQQLQQQQQQQVQQQASSSPPVTGEQEEGNGVVDAAAVDAAPALEEVSNEGDETVKSEEETQKERLNAGRQRRRRSPSGRNGSRGKSAAADTAETPASQTATSETSEAGGETESQVENPGELDQTAAE